MEEVNKAQISGEGQERLLIDELLNMEQQGDTHALLEFLRDNTERHFPQRFRNIHRALNDPTLSLANLKKDEKRRVLALRNLLMVHEMARRFWFEVENDNDFFIQALQEEVSLLNQLSKGDGTMLYVIRSTFKEVGFTQPGQERQNLLSRLLRR